MSMIISPTIVEKHNCNTCNASVLESTKIECGGLCMPCYMKNNHGFRPSEIASIKNRGLSNILNQWNDLVRQGVPNIRNPKISEKFYHYIPIVQSSVIGCFRSKETKFDKEVILKLLTELKSLGNKELEIYINQVEAFVLEFIRATKS